MKSINRRTFLEFLGIGAASAVAMSCTPFSKSRRTPFILTGIAPSAEDKVVLAKGLRHELLLTWNDPLSDADRFGFNNDYLAFLPFDKSQPNDGLLWANHEYTDPMFVSGYFNEGEKTKEQVEREMYSVGGSIVRVRKNEKKWEVVLNDPLNRRITGATEIAFNWHEPILGSTSAQGTLGNCAGGVTPWGTILTCEENYDMFYGERDYNTGKRMRNSERNLLDFQWYKHFSNPPEHYGWVVEVNPQTGEAQKHIALGRCAHECATVVELEDGRIVVYMGDDANDQCLYKFISSEPRSLLKGTLYVANTMLGKWMPLDFGQQKALQAKFANQTDVLIRLREAAKLVGATPLDRPEDIEIHPTEKGWVFVTLTNNTARKNYVGSILKILETDGKHDSLTFQAETYKTGGKQTGFASPDNMAFDFGGNLWFTSDMSGSLMNKHEEYLPFKNNGLFVVPSRGEQAGKVVQVASAPVDAEFTGPWFAPDGETLFLSVQHPGEYSKSLKELRSHWPNGGKSIPRSAVIAISGELISALNSGG